MALCALKKHSVTQLHTTLFFIYSDRTSGEHNSTDPSCSRRLSARLLSAFLGSSNWLSVSICVVNTQGSTVSAYWSIALEGVEPLGSKQILITLLFTGPQRLHSSGCPFHKYISESINQNEWAWAAHESNISDWTDTADRFPVWCHTLQKKVVLNASVLHVNWEHHNSSK